MVFIKLCFVIAVMLLSFASAEQPVEKEPRTLLFWCYSSYKCPANSYFLPHRWCYKSFHDCGCNHGYYKSLHEDKCLPNKKEVVVKPPVAKCYSCPSNSYGKFFSTCFKDFFDCECKKGYVKSLHEKKCIRKDEKKDEEDEDDNED